jgi:hypothetical protein
MITSLVLAAALAGADGAPPNQLTPAETKAGWLRAAIAK